MSEDDSFVLLPDQTYCDNNEHGDSDGDQQDGVKRQNNSFHPDYDLSLVEYPREMEKILRKIKKQEITKWHHMRKFCNERKTLNDMPTMQHTQPKQQKPPKRNDPEFFKKPVQFTRSDVEKEGTNSNVIKTKTSTSNISTSKSPQVGKLAIIAPSQRLYQQQKEGDIPLNAGSHTDFLQRPAVKTICVSDIKADKGILITPPSEATECNDALSDTIKERLSESRSKLDSFPPTVSRGNVTPCNLEIILNTIALNGLDKVNILLV